MQTNNAVCERVAAHRWHWAAAALAIWTAVSATRAVLADNGTPGGQVGAATQSSSQSTAVQQDDFLPSAPLTTETFNKFKLKADVVASPEIPTTVQKGAFDEFKRQPGAIATPETPVAIKDGALDGIKRRTDIVINPETPMASREDAFDGLKRRTDVNNPTEPPRVVEGDAFKALLRRIVVSETSSTASDEGLSQYMDKRLVKLRDELLQGADELFKAGRMDEAREAFAAALANEPETQTLSRAATGIVQTFQETATLNLAACKTWTQAHIASAQGRQRVDLAIGELYYRNQDYEHAVGQLAEVAGQKGYVAESASMIIALCLLAKGEQAAALARLEDVAGRTSSNEIAAKAIFLIGWANLQSQQYASARSAFDRLVTKYPQSQFAKKATELSDRLKTYMK